MSMDWIKMRGDLYSDPEVVRAARLCKVDRDTIVGRLHRTWAWADKVTADGFVGGMTADDLNETLGIKGWAQALQTVGWLEVTDDGLRFPRFDRHNGKSAKRRATDTDRKQEERRKSSATCPQNVRNEIGQTSDQRREEKRREEIQEEKDICPDPSLRSGRDRPPAIAWGTDGWAGITPEHRKVWGAAYPSVSIDGELAKAHAWLLANPTRAGKRNWARFLNTWLAKTHEGGGNGRASGQSRGGYQTPTAAAADRRRERSEREFDQTLDLPVVRFEAGGRRDAGTDGRGEVRSAI